MEQFHIVQASNTQQTAKYNSVGLLRSPVCSRVQLLWSPVCSRVQPLRSPVCSRVQLLRSPVCSRVQPLRSPVCSRVQLLRSPVCSRVQPLRSPVCSRVQLLRIPVYSGLWSAQESSYSGFQSTPDSGLLKSPATPDSSLVNSPLRVQSFQSTQTFQSPAILESNHSRVLSFQSPAQESSHPKSPVFSQSITLRKLIQNHGFQFTFRVKSFKKSKQFKKKQPLALANLLKITMYTFARTKATPEYSPSRQ